MSRRRFMLLNVLLIVLLALTAAVAAQGDSDGDGIPDTADSCPNQAGPRENSGCPLPVTTPEVNEPSADRDGDGVADFVDSCPDQAGTGFNNGCPANAGDQPAPTPGSAARTPTMIWESLDRCLVGVPMNAPNNVNVREQPTTNSAVLGQLVPGQQFEPWLRDYDANNQVWFDGAPAGDTYGWVSGAVVITNGQCTYLPQVIHVDADDSGAFSPTVEVTFDPSLLPLPELPDDDGDGFDFAELFDFDVVVIDWSAVDFTPDDGAPTPTPDGSSAPRGGHVKVFDGSGLELTFLMGDGSVMPTDGLTPFLIGHPQGDGETCLIEAAGWCIEVILLLPPPGASPEVGDPVGLCPTDQFPALLDLSSGGDDSEIGLLLPAVQKVREAAARMHATGGGGGTGKVSLQDFHFNALIGLLADPPDPDLADTCVVPMYISLENTLVSGITDGVLIGLLLPAVQR